MDGDHFGIWRKSCNSYVISIKLNRASLSGDQGRYVLPSLRYNPTSIVALLLVKNYTFLSIALF